MGPGFQSMYAQGTAKFEDYPNKITPRLVFDLLALRPALKMSEIHCPFLIVYGKDDDVLAPQIAIDAERRAPESNCSSIIANF
jgi:pimeloyl-ACP methyl ester carboxylesterase